MVRHTRANNPTKSTRPKTSEVTTTLMANPRIWDTAMKLAGGDAKRITIVSSGRLEVLVNETPPKVEKERAPQVTIPKMIQDEPALIIDAPVPTPPKKRATRKPTNPVVEAVFSQEVPA
jgi:hypothetical protein